MSTRPSHSDTTSLNTTRLAIVGGTLTAGVVAIQLYQANAWWKTAQGPFHFEEDLVYAKNIDKIGHLYGANVLTYTFSKSLQWANMSESQALTWGAIGSTLFQTYIEVKDGFSVYWGFDRVDFAGDVVGAWYPVLQHHVPFMKNFNFRFSYLPKSSGSQGAIAGQTHTMMDDYEGQTMWLTFSMKNLLPRVVSEPWPSWLCLSVGAAVRNNNSPDRYLVFFVAPDLDMTKIIPQDTAFLRTLSEVLNFVHLPLPAVRLAPNMVWYLVYF